VFAHVLKGAFAEYTSVPEAAVLAPFVSQRLAPFEAKPSGDDLRLLKELIEAGEVSPVIDRTYQP
jgi:hypothetical protein